ncbi:substrate-binding domain-containing protein [Christensenellaceae bacterium OttesenSCG-928-M15]|nr:substrate-binding domain-containing protein [Christensenellaceae bacterium OttesenSCG-928-M15]
MKKRQTIAALVFLLLVSFVLLGACSGGDANGDSAITPTPAPTGAADETQKTAPAYSAQKRSVSQTLVGFVVPNSDEISVYTLKHGFLRMAENLGYPAKLYLSSMGAESVAAVEQAANDGCAGLLIYNKGNENDIAIEKAAALHLPVVVPYHDAACSGVTTNVVADLNGYNEEVALGVAERMVERSLKSGKILVYGGNPAETANAFREAIATYYPQYNVDSFIRTKNIEQEAIDELAEYLLWNRDIKGLFCTDVDGATTAAKAREKAEKDFKANGAPEENTEAVPPANQPQPDITPVPENLLKQIIISVAGYGLSDDTIALMRTNDIYAFVLEPYYEASAQSLMLLDRILNNETVPTVSRLNMPIVRIGTLEKYVLIHEQVLDWFSLRPKQAD